MSSDDELSSDVELRPMAQYETTVIEELEHPSDPHEPDETPDQLRDRIRRLKRDLDLARDTGKKRQIDRLEKELAEAQLKSVLPKSIAVDLEQAATGDPAAMPQSDDSLSKFWHCKVMQMNFSGDDAINLTLDDSDPSVFQGRTAFLQEHCEPYTEMHHIDDSLCLPLAIWNSLFPHQRVAVEWLWGLWQDQKGGIEGDEMGLGKTAIICAFLLALLTSNLLTKPVLVLCPLTVGQQWIRELHIWSPQLRAILLHGMRTNQSISDEDILANIDGTPSVVVTNYETLHRLKESMILHLVDWGIVVCDEGHKIRNHESGTSKLVKRLTADMRLAVSGSPIQNSLVELWSLFDFAVPGLLGTLDVFEREYADPIKAGGYANANSFVVFRAYTAAVSLRDLIKPFLLRRVKSQVQANLPEKTEQIFFVQLTRTQESAYQEFLDSPLCRTILSGHAEAFVGIDHLRKICDHPALLDDSQVLPTPEHSAKLVLLQKILPQWDRKNHRALVFSQYLAMLSLIESLMNSLGLSYLSNRWENK
jgi:DNA excision repair protein ERCC-6